MRLFRESFFRLFKADVWLVTLVGKTVDMPEAQTFVDMCMCSLVA